MESFDNAVAEFVAFKTEAGLPSVGAFGYDVSSKSSLVERICCSATEKDTGNSASSASGQLDVVGYYLLRRYLTRNGREATAAFLEDVHTYHSIRAAGSRAKWARAIVASVETESASCPILKAMTAPVPPAASSTAPPVSIAPSRTASFRATAPAPTTTTLLTSPIAASVSAPPFGGSAGTSAASSASGSASTATPAAAWAHARSAVLTCSTGQMLPDRLFDGLYAHVSREVQGSVMPAFLASREATILNGLNSFFARPSADSSAGAGSSSSSSFGAPRSIGMPASSTTSGPAAVLSRDAFDQLGCIGSGSYGSVHVWRHRATDALYACKAMSKKVLKLKGSVHTVIRELSCTLAVDSPFVCGVEWAFSDDDHVYVGLPLCPHGDLERFLLSQPLKRFDEQTARMYAAEIAIALKHLHMSGVMHRDLKASNILIDSSGHLRLTDFGLAVLSHNCGKEAPSGERICRGERSDVIRSCCLGCQQVQKLKSLTTAAHAAAGEGKSSRAAGRAAAEAMTTDPAFLASLSASGYSSGASGRSACGCGCTSSGTLRRGPSSYSLLSEEVGRTLPHTSSAASMTSSGAASPRAGPAAAASASRAGGSIHDGGQAQAQQASTHSRGLTSFRSFFGGVAAPSSTGTASTTTTGNRGRATIKSPNAAATPLASGAGAQPTAPGLSYHQHRLSRIGSGMASPKVAGSSAHAAGGSEDLAGLATPSCTCASCDVHRPTAGAPCARPWRERFAKATVNPVCVMDCDCGAERDGADGWYRGRAGTAAYWCREMLVRGTDGERLPYGFSCDWFSFGSLVYCLQTGRSPFSSGLGTAYDNQLTIEGRIAFPRGMFSREARDLISRLTHPDPAQRLGSGAQGWAAVQAHPWFAGIDWALLEARVLPPPVLPAYRMPLGLLTAPAKMEGQEAQAAAAAEHDAATLAEAQKLTCDAEDEAVFAAITYVSPGLIARNLIKAVAHHGATGSTSAVPAVDVVMS